MYASQVLEIISNTHHPTIHKCLSTPPSNLKISFWYLLASRGTLNRPPRRQLPLPPLFPASFPSAATFCSSPTSSATLKPLMTAASSTSHEPPRQQRPPWATNTTRDRQLERHRRRSSTAVSSATAVLTHSPLIVRISQSRHLPSFHNHGGSRVISVVCVLDKWFLHFCLFCVPLQDLEGGNFFICILCYLCRQSSREEHLAVLDLILHCVF